MSKNLSISLDDYQGHQIEKSFEVELEKGGQGSGRKISRIHLEGVKKNLKCTTSKKFLSNILNRSGDMIEVSPKEDMLIGLIKRDGKISQSQFPPNN